MTMLRAVPRDLELHYRHCSQTSYIRFESVYLKKQHFYNYSHSDALDASNQGAIPTSEAVEGLGYYLSGHDFLDIPGLDISPTAFPQLTVGAWVKVCLT